MKLNCEGVNKMNVDNRLSITCRLKNIEFQSLTHWKQIRSKLVISIGEEIVKYDEQNLNKIFKSWESEINELSKDSSVQSRLNLLMIISILVFYRRDPDHNRFFQEIISKLFQNQAPDIALGAIQVMQIVAQESDDPLPIVKEPMESAFKCLSSGQSVFNSLSLIQAIKEMTVGQFQNLMTKAFERVLGYAYSKDIKIYPIAADLIQYYILNLNIEQKFDFIKNTIRKIISYYCSSLNSGALLIIKAVFIKYKHFFKRLFPDLLPKLLENDTEFIFTIENEFPGELAEANIKNFADRVLSSYKKTYEEQYFVAIINLVNTFPKYIDSDQIVHTMQSILQDSKAANIHPQIFQILTVLGKQFNTITIEQSQLVKVNLSVEFIDFLKTQPTICTDLVIRLKEYFYNEKKPSSISFAIARAFPQIVFENIDAAYEAIFALAFSIDAEQRMDAMRTIATLHTDAAELTTIKNSLYDTDKRIRLSACEFIKPSLQAATYQALPRLLHDSCFHVRRSALKLFAKLLPLNEFDIAPMLDTYIKHCITQLRSESSPKILAKTASLFPVITKYIVPLLPDCAHEIMTVCISVLRPQPSDPSEVTESARFSIISDTANRDLTTDPESLLDSKTRMGAIFQLAFKPYILKRDSALIKSIANLGTALEPHLQDVLRTFMHFFEIHGDDSLLETAVQCLTQLTASFYNGLNIRLLCPELITVLSGLLGTTKSEAVAVAIIKLFGTACDSFSGMSNAKEDAKQRVITEQITTPGFFTTFVLKNLMPYFKEPTLKLLYSIALIFQGDPEHACKSLSQVVPMFIQEINKGQNVDMAFSYFEVVAVTAKYEIEPFLEDITQAILKYIGVMQCVHFTAALSITLMNAFKPSAAKLFIPVIRRIDTQDPAMFRIIHKTATFMIAYQGQPTSMYLDAIDRVKNMDAERMEIVANSLTGLIQNIDVTDYYARICCFALSKIQYIHSPGVTNLIATLIAFGGIEKSLAVTALNTVNVRYDLIKDYFDLPLEMHFTVLEEGGKSTKEYFMDFSYPEQVDVGPWLENLCWHTVRDAPSAPIRACSQLLKSHPKLREALFPISFLNCWMVATVPQREHFSNIVNRIIYNHTIVDPTFMNLIETLDHSGIPMHIDLIKAAEVTTSRPFALFLLQRELLKDPGNHELIERVLHVNSQMNRLTSMRGTFEASSAWMDSASSAHWLEALNEWEPALELYNKNPEENLNAILRCHLGLENWEEITKLMPEYEKMPLKERIDNSMPILWGCFHMGNRDAIQAIISEFHTDVGVTHVRFASFYEISNGHYKQAQLLIEQAFKKLAERRAVFSEGDPSQIRQGLLSAQLLIEQQEALNNKSEGTTITGAWKQRIKGFTRDAYMWMRLIMIRRLVVDPNNNIGYYIKMISALRKDRQWQIIDAYFPKLSSPEAPPDVQLAYSKVLFHRGDVQRAIEVNENVIATFEPFLDFKHNDFINEMINDPLSFFYHIKKNLLTTKYLKMIEETTGMTIDEIQEFLENAPEPERMHALAAVVGRISPTFGALFGFNQNKFESRAFRQLGLYYRHIDNMNDLSRLGRITAIFAHASNLNGSDYRNWVQWAEANARMSEESEVFKDNLSLNAITGLLKAIHMNAPNSLEILCQLLSHFFRIRDEALFPEKLCEDFLSLSPSVIMTVIPQIVVQISHKIPMTRSIVHKLLNNFGSDHFDPLFFPLKLMISTEDEEKKIIASNILMKLSERHRNAAADMELFFDGMLRSAVTWFEMWVPALTSANKLQDAGDIEGANKILRSLFTQFDNPKCFLDRIFIRHHAEKVKLARSILENKHTQRARNEMWATLHQIYTETDRTVKKLEAIILTKISEPLALKRNFEMAIPGMYAIGRPYPMLESVEHLLQVLRTQQHPRCLYLISNEGKRLKFLLKGNDDIRIDQRLMQFFVLINSVLKQNRITRNTGATITKYSVVPLSTNTGLISWVTGADTLHQVITEYRQAHNIPPLMEYEVIAQYAAPPFHNMTQPQKLEMYDIACKQVPGSDVRQFLWEKSPSAFTWLSRTESFTVTTALMSIVGYIIGLGDRHPSNIMIQRETGRVIHIDFGDSFEVTLHRPRFPERVPFRLTRMIVSALDSCSVNGLFMRAAVDAMTVLRENRTTLTAQLEIFVHDPLSMPELGRDGIMSRIVDKLGGRDGENGGEAEGPELQVKRLVSAAADPGNFITHYFGWCPFW